METLSKDIIFQKFGNSFTKDEIENILKILNKKTSFKN